MLVTLLIFSVCTILFVKLITEVISFFISVQCYALDTTRILPARQRDVPGILVHDERRSVHCSSAISPRGYRCHALGSVAHWGSPSSDRWCDSNHQVCPPVHSGLLLPGGVGDREWCRYRDIYPEDMPVRDSDSLALPIHLTVELQ